MVKKERVKGKKENKKMREKKEEKGGKREKEEVEKRVQKREKRKYRKAKMNRCMWKRFTYIQEKLCLVKNYRKKYRRLTWLMRKSDSNQFKQLILISTNISQKQNKKTRKKKKGVK